MPIVNFKKIGLDDVTTSKFQDNVDDALSQISSLKRYWQKPSFEWTSDTSLRVRGRDRNPPKIQINDALYSITDDLTCNLQLSGIGGLRTGVSLVANTPYYLYAISNGSSVRLIADSIGPSDGPLGFDWWTYLGSFATHEGSAVVIPFVSCDGLYMSDDEIETETHTGTILAASKTFAGMPVTVRLMWAMLIGGGAAANVVYRAFGTNNSSYNGIWQTGQVAGINVSALGWIPILTEKTAYVQESNAGNTCSLLLMGWKEDLAEYP